ncbi:MAG: hypothetical protein LQ339_003911 [Xanthoria mediterranea]|nr:MAG: hypothetical protein LQ339_003911 [Xanthoria mediterranea]
MADQNISQILAALAAQRPGGTPLQGQPPPQQQQQQQPPPQAYPQPAYPIPTPPINSAPYGLPQPSSSGSLDLSNIKPSNSGSVSLADAVARARGFAAEKGVSFRDNYNPYRDERRGDPRRDGGSYNRERSLSPRRNYSPTGGRGFGGRSPPGRGGDELHETITIESNLVGLIIGRQGENLRRVENETSTRVQFLTGPESSGPIRQCKISGPQRAREDAKREIARIIADNGKELGKSNLNPIGVKSIGAHAPALRAGEDATQILVPNRTVGLIIGRGGETIRDLQERSGCHVNIVGEEKSVNGFRPVNLIGTPQAAAVARQLIDEIVESDTKNMNAQSAGNRDVGRGQPMFGGGDEKINDNITVPSEAVGMIIGKGGETIKDMQQTTGCKINVSQPNGRDVERDIGLVGSRGAIEAAKRAIMDKVHAVEDKNRSQNPNNFRDQRDDRRDDRYNNNNNNTTNDRYAPISQQPSQSSYSQQQQMSQSQQGDAAGAAAADPYAAYGGYQAYVALWYQSLAQQGQQGQAGQQQPGGGGGGATGS